MLIRAISTVVLLAVTVSPALAQEQVTIVKRDGGRVAGRFEAWARNTNLVYVRVSQNDQQRIPLNDVQVMEVGGGAQDLPAHELVAARGSEHVLVLTSGEILRGRLVNIEGGEGSDSPNEPRMVTFKPSSGDERRARMTEVRRFYSGNYPAAAEAAPAPPPAAAPSGSIQVPANMRWTSTGIVLGRGDQIQVQASGEVQLSADGGDKASPAGSTSGRRAAGAPVPVASAGALIGRVGNGPAFPIGDRSTPFVPAGVGGELVLGVNDDELSDNQGAFTVVIRQIRRR